MNKAELIDVLERKLGTDPRQATDALEYFVDTIVRAVQRGSSVNITGFGDFEQRPSARLQTRPFPVSRQPRPIRFLSYLP